ncbi:hypothetical protein VNO80_33933 [Phaseolus coccineus]|uniref:Uncharacterized protein n=1 Tax=Phaseolus coccineus TaxID=3886 RepID=A0AAN9QC27_PHACN
MLCCLPLPKNGGRASEAPGSERIVGTGVVDTRMILEQRWENYFRTAPSVDESPSASLCGLSQTAMEAASYLPFFRYSTGSVARKLLFGSKLRDSLGYISAGPARDLDLGTNSPSAPSASLTASLVGVAEMIGLVSVDVTATKNWHFSDSCFHWPHMDMAPKKRTSIGSLGLSTEENK